MAFTVNKVMLLGRLTRDPESVELSGGTMIAKFGLAVDADRKKNAQTGEYENVPCFLDCEAFDWPDHKGFRMAAHILEKLHKGDQIFVEGSLKMDTWEGQDGQKRQAIRVKVLSIVTLIPKDASQQNQARQQAPVRTQPPRQQQAPQAGSEEEIPFSLGWLIPWIILGLSL